MKIKTYIILVVLIAFISCNKNENAPIVETNLLIGNWSKVIYENDQLIFNRVNELPKEEYGLSFKEEYPTFLEKTSGWCGTPPLSFFDIEGTWEIKKDILKIYDAKIPHVEGASPTLLHHFKITSLTNDTLILKRELTEQEKDHRELMVLFNEFYELAKSKNCNDSNNWTFTSYGAKACGGPQGYIAYSKDIDVPLFLEKIEKYSKLENEFNRKWGIISTCDILAEPKKVVCKNGYPVLKY